ncbi:hypothetical protein [Agarivorans litoreus]|uniref:hypothetical protein n=1 Tax=Agarivorans litoreus TaxID=1510455 RepID=UPI001C7D3DB5|nr:hypothetical protein [Agarivorans litoreus]
MSNPVNAKEIDQIKHNYQFAVCTLVTDLSEYQGMLKSFASVGFSEENTQFIYADNSKSNKLDAYQAIRKFLTHSDANYIILCHQDILLNFDDKEKLESELRELDQIDPNWGLCGNAGYIDFKHYAMRISDPHGENINVGNFPAQVKSLDENFIIVKKESALSISKDLSGFHLYGTDMCIIAEILGLRSYVIDFHLLHNSGGNINKSFEVSKKELLNKYAKALSNKYIRSTCTKLIITNISWLNTLFNRSIIYSLRKRLESFSSSHKKYK